MRSSPRVASAALALCWCHCRLAPALWSSRRRRWRRRPWHGGRLLAKATPKGVTFVFGDAVLWGTLSPTVRSDRAALRDYFVTAFKVLPGVKVAFGDQLIRVYGNAAVNTGYYTFSYVKDGETKSLPARYSFTYVKNGERWLIVDHHSSAMPSTPR